MKVHNISINQKYFEPIREGKISLLFFKTKVVRDGQPGDYILASKGNYDVKAKIVRTYIKAFEDVTDKEAQKAGFLNKDFLRDELANRYDLKQFFDVITGTSIDEEIFFLIELNTNEEEHVAINNPVRVNLYSKQYNKEFYNPEYDGKPWRDLS